MLPGRWQSALGTIGNNCFATQLIMKTKQPMKPLTKAIMYKTSISDSTSFAKQLIMIVKTRKQPLKS